MDGATDTLARQVADDFPILGRKVHDKRLVYLDSAASSQKPRQVIDAMDNYYRTFHSNIHRSPHTLGEEATAGYEDARKHAAAFVGADARDLVFTKNVTEAFNLIAYSWGLTNLGAGDRIVISTLEHHSNIVPWFIVAEKTGARVQWLPLVQSGDTAGQIDMDAAARIIPGAKLVAISAASNVLGTITPVAEICRLARETGAISVVDGAQRAPHLETDVGDIGADFFGFTSHKMLGPTGIGCLWGRRELLDTMPPFLGGGEMIETVGFDGFTTAPVPAKFEAGTMPIAEAIGLGAAVDYLDKIGMDSIRAHELDLLEYAIAALDDTFSDKIAIYGPRDLSMRSGIVSFNLGNIHPHDLATVLDADGVAIRAGHHCAKPLMDDLGVTATARASFYLYNTRDDIDVLIHALGTAAELFGI